MQVKIITLPFDPTGNVFEDDTINKFTMNKQIISMKSQFFYHNDLPYWSVYIVYNVDVDLTMKEDLKSSLDQPGLLFYKRLQEWRKIKADENKIPVFIIATNKQLTDIIIEKPRTLEALRMIDGFAKKKVTKYGNDIISMVKNFYDKKPIQNVQAKKRVANNKNKTTFQQKESQQQENQQQKIQQQENQQDKNQQQEKQ
ncbi:HRDC domain-containing protein [Candidatus Magnetomorum sp. HK-1]|nr:HRDC domain-containing protein [Candidatus Magnetomorum sp. HK-1]